ncbi:MAG TPA: DNA-directed RNA polymerase subunit beta', partial [Clostridiales bacterium]|nr:DNA-directed RNA polymerase subunit beta' [Clostridiales bacterium]
HTGGVAGGDITQGLPRVEEIFEARRPKTPAIIAEFDGVVTVEKVKNIRSFVLTGSETGEVKVYPAYSLPLKVEEGATVYKGQALTEGFKVPADIVRIEGLDAVYDYIVREIQRVYKLQAVDINDKHVEVIARQMTRKIKVEDSGDTKLLLGALIEINEFNLENEIIAKRVAAGELSLREAVGSPVLLGITKAALSTDSFLSAASFQETTKVLTEA